MGKDALALAFAFLIAFPGAAAAEGEAGAQSKAPTIEVSGSGSVHAEPDTANIRVGVITENASAQEAVAANTAAVTKVMSELQAASIDKRDLKTSNFSVFPQYRIEGESKKQVLTYRVSNTVTVTVRDISKAGDILTKVVSAGSNQINGPVFSVSDPEKYLNEARKKAVENAIAKATAYASAAGLKLGAILSISERGAGGPLSFTAGYRSVGGAPVPVEAGEETIQAQVLLVIELKQ
jgi:uncharacterized protein YggE